MNALDHPLTRAYLDDLANALRGADPERRQEILEQIADHVAASVPTDTPPDDATIRAVLDRLGPPSDIAAAADVTPYGMPTPTDTPLAPATTPAPETPRRGSGETWAIVAFAVSPVLCLIGWIVGVVLLWSSRVWTTRHKVIGTIALLPFAFVITIGSAAFVVTARSSSSVEVAPVIASEPPGIGATPQDEPTTTVVPEVVDAEPERTWPEILVLAAWFVVGIAVPIATLVWLHRAARPTAMAP